jgi:thiaminase/transcriptional activator TenA
MQTFTGQLWESVRPTYEAILMHPFITELADGSLGRDRFAFYMKQDALYLQDFARALAITGTRAPEADQTEAFLGFAHGAISVERLLHGTYFEEFGVSLDVDQSPACLAYTQFLLARAATGSYAESVAALLPCFWIYREVGLAIVRRATANNPYRRWIDTYSGEAFGQTVERAIAITEAVGASAPEAERVAMRCGFDRSARLEWLFWDSAYRLESWPPG